MSHARERAVVLPLSVDVNANDEDYPIGLGGGRGLYPFGQPSDGSFPSAHPHPLFIIPLPGPRRPSFVLCCALFLRALFSLRRVHLLGSTPAVTFFFPFLERLLHENQVDTRIPPPPVVCVCVCKSRFSN